MSSLSSGFCCPFDALRDCWGRGCFQTVLCPGSVVFLKAHSFSATASCASWAAPVICQFLSTWGSNPDNERASFFEQDKWTFTNKSHTFSLLFCFSQFWWVWFFFSFCLIFTQYVVLLQAIVMNHWKLGKGSWISRQNFYLLKINGRILTVSHQTFTVLTKHSGRREIRLGSSYNSWI